MDLSVKAKLALAAAASGMDLSVNRTTCNLLGDVVDTSVEKSEQESEEEDEDDDSTSASMSSGSDSEEDDLEMDPSTERTDLRVLRRRTVGVASKNDNSDFGPSIRSESEDTGVGAGIRRETECSVMDLRVHSEQDAAAIKIEATRTYEEETLAESSTEESSGSEEEEERAGGIKREVGGSPLGSDAAENDGVVREMSTEARFQRELQLFSEKQFAVVPSVFARVDVVGLPVLEDAATEGAGEAKREGAEGGGETFLNVADFLELETKVTGEASVETHATDVTFTCTACDLSFSSTLYLTQHVKHCRKLKANCLKPPPPPTPVLAENKGATISDCTYRSNPGGVKKKKRAGYVLATCNLCGADLRNNRSLKQHMFLHRLEAGERPFACADCPASFTQNCDLTKHKRQHTGEKPYACDSCDARFTLVSNLSKHRKKHTGEKPHACPQCGATFAESGSLTRHARQHSGERPYACADCGATFGQSSSLTRHKRKHTGERPYACNVCGARFTESGNLNSHRRLHTGEKPYTCVRCGQGHARLSYLKNHARNCRTVTVS